ncbi:MAG: aminotransferase class V-fold PLP-dependent enzyme [Candidatus Villigracilaceae bacterium]
MDRIYLDYAATTPVDSRVLEVMLPFFSASFGNPLSVHRYGQRAEAAVDDAGFACSSGSACKTGNPQPSEVMAAIGLSRAWGLGFLRVTLGKDSTSEHVESFLAALPGIVEQARRLV